MRRSRSLLRSSTPYRPNFLILEDRATPATLTVDTTADVVMNNGQLSLREAILIANDNTGNTKFEGIGSTDSTDTITFTAGLGNQTINLLGDGNVFTPDDLELTSNVNITAPSSGPVTVRGNYTVQSGSNNVFDIDSGVTVSIAGLIVTLPQTNASGGISNNGNLTLTNVTITDCKGGSGLINDEGATATLVNCTITSNINDSGEAPGGGISNFGTLTITGGRIANNQTTDDNAGAGGGIFHAGPSLTLNDVEVSGNTAKLAGGGLALGNGTTTIAGSTKLIGNNAQFGGGMAIIGIQDGSTLLKPTVNATGTLIDNNTAISAAGVAITATTDMVIPTVKFENVNVTNNKAEENATGSITLMIDTGGPTPSTFTVPRGNGGGFGISRGDITVTGGSISGNRSTLAGGFGLQLGTLRLTNTTVANNFAITGGGGVVVATSSGTPTLELTSTTFDNNNAELNATGTISVSIPGTTTPDVPRGTGGGLAIAGGNVTINQGQFLNNDATQGGGLVIQAGTLTLNNVNIRQNTATSFTGGLAVAGGAVTLTDSNVSANTAKAAAGIGLSDGTLSVVRSTIFSNVASGKGNDGSGGGIGVFKGNLSLLNSTVDGNSADQGGGLAIGGGTITVFSSTITANTSATLAGGIGINTGQTVTLRNSVVALNTAPLAADVGGSVTSGGGNFLGVGDFVSGLVGSDQKGTTIAPLDPKLGGLRNNGGLTFTRLPNSDSPLVNTGNGTDAPGTDQRGRTRIVGAGIDIGSTERQADDPSTTPTVPDTPPTTPPNTPPTGPATPSKTGAFGIGSDAGTAATVTVLNPDGSTAFSATPFGSGFIGGVRVVSADVNNDGVPDIIVGTGPGSATKVRVINGKDQSELLSFDPFEAGFTGGVFVAAGDLNGDGFADIAITPDEGGGPRVRVFSGKDGSQIADFFGIEDPNFRGGARAAIADVNGDGRADLLVAAGFGGGPRLAIFNGMSIPTGGPVKLLPDFFVFEQSLRNGVFITGGDLNGDGAADVIVGGGPGGGPRVFALSGRDLANGTQTPVANFFAGDPNGRGGVRVGVANLDGDNRADLITGAGKNSGSNVTTYAGSAVTSSDNPSSLRAFDAFPGFNGGVFVG